MISIIIPSTRDSTASEKSAKVQNVDKEIIIVKDSQISPGKARNIGVALSKGEWLAFLDDDDIWYANYLETSLDESFELIITQHDKTIVKKRKPRTKEQMLRVLQTGAGVAHGSGLLMKRTLFERVGGFSESTRTSEVWKFCYDAIRLGMVKENPYSLWIKGFNKEQLSKSRTNHEILEERKRFLNA